VAILHKNALYYRTERGARVGDILMSLIQTARINGENQRREPLRVSDRAPAKRGRGPRETGGVVALDLSGDSRCD
jgi:hypothetical protein